MFGLFVYVIFCSCGLIQSKENEKKIDYCSSINFESKNAACDFLKLYNEECVVNNLIVRLWFFELRKPAVLFSIEKSNDCFVIKKKVIPHDEYNPINYNPINGKISYQYYQAIIKSEDYYRIQSIIKTIKFNNDSHWFMPNGSRIEFHESSKVFQHCEITYQSSQVLELKKILSSY
jgi:hypothetical protein